MRKLVLILVPVFGFALAGAAYAGGGGCSHGSGVKTTEGYSPIAPDTTTAAPTSGTEKTKS